MIKNLSLPGRWPHWSGFALFAMFACCQPRVLADESEQNLWKAARQGDAATVKTLIGQGVDVDAPARYGATALSFACDHGHPDVVKLLVEAGANVNVTDTFYHATPLDWAAMGGHTKSIQLLLEHGAKGGKALLRTSTEGGALPIVQAILAAVKIEPEFLTSCRDMADERQYPEIVQAIEAAIPATSTPARVVPDEVMQSYAGTYKNDEGQSYQIECSDGKLLISSSSMRLDRLRARNEQTFYFFETTYTFNLAEGQVVGFTRNTGTVPVLYKKMSDNDVLDEVKDEPSQVVVPTHEESTTVSQPIDPLAVHEEDRAVSSIHWPQFRGTGARGIADGQNPSMVWDVPEAKGVLWKTPIAGLGNSCPVVWGNQVFLTTAIQGGDRATLRTGLYGDVGSVDDDSTHAWQVICLNLTTGKMEWERTALEAIPLNKRHPKSTHANPTPATDGQCVIAFFGSEGLYCYNMQGQLQWKKVIGSLDSGWFYDEEYQWGFGSSPILYDGKAIVQCDVQHGSFIAAYDVRNGDEIWKTDRDEIPTWNTPTLYEGISGPLLITGGTRYARGYDPRTGSERWRLDRQSEISVPTPFVVGDLVFVTSGYRPIKPIYAIRLTAEGDISLDDEQTSNEHIAWSNQDGGPYLPTPIVYRGWLYVCKNNGVLTCYDARTGQREYRERLRGGGATSFTASPVAADGKLYFTSEQGVVMVVQAGPKFELLSTNPLGEHCLATPAISSGRMLFRTEGHLIAVGEE
ncbi:MAG: hypothetical protein CMJ72_07105 [Planctomycetaceae bacterium]|nr:hypothetical protein [Planctomycetaceae bacterium]